MRPWYIYSRMEIEIHETVRSGLAQFHIQKFHKELPKV